METWRRLRGLRQRLRSLAREQPPGRGSRGRRQLAHFVRVCLWVARWEVYDRLKLHAQALTYDTLLALVPLIAVVMAVVRGFGNMGPLADRLQALIVDSVAGSAEMQGAVADPLRAFVLHVQTGGLGALSLCLLIFSVLSLLGHIEFAFNVIFGAPRQRPLLRRFTLYWAVLTLGPLLLGASLAARSALLSTSAASYVEQFGPVHALALRAVPWLTTWVAFAATYLLVPLTPVRPQAALPAAVVAGSLWQGGKGLYAIYAHNAFAVHNIYGSLAAVPLFILWLYVSWLLVLFGAQLAFALQHEGANLAADAAGPAHAAARELAVCRIFLAIAVDFHLAQPPSERDQLAARLALPVHLVEDLVTHLCATHFVRDTDGGRRLLPARELQQVSVADLLQSLRHAGSSPTMRQDAATDFLVTLLGELEADRQKRAGTADFHGLASRFAAPLAAPPGAPPDAAQAKPAV